MSESITRPYVLRFMLGPLLRLRAAVDARHHLGRPIRREYELPAYAANGNKLTDQRAMREGLVCTCEEHLRALAADFPGEEVLAYAGNGNLLANPGFVAWIAGKLFHLEEEPVFHRAYHCLLSWRDGHASLEPVWFALENGQTVVVRQTGQGMEDITDQIEFATSGQPLVRDGQAVELAAIADEWYDTRHLVRSVRLAVNGTSLYYPNAQLMQGLARKALVGPLHLKMETQVDEQTVLPLKTQGWLRLAAESPEAACRAQRFLKQHGALKMQETLKQASGLLHAACFAEQLLADGLQEAGYQAMEQAGSLREGQYRFLNGHIEIYLKKAVYPHNMFVRWADGSCGFVVFPGASGRSGTTLPGAQQMLIEQLQVQDALLLDNGGDVRLWYRGQEIVRSSEDRPQVRGLLALTAPAGAPLALRAVSMT